MGGCEKGGASCHGKSMCDHGGVCCSGEGKCEMADCDHKMGGACCKGMGHGMGEGMGHGKGAPEYYVAVVKPGRILYEIDGIDEATAREALRLAMYKLPVKTKIVGRSEI